MKSAFRKSAKQYYSDPLLHNLLQAVFNKYQGQNGVRGNAKIQVETKAEADRLQDFFGNRMEKLIRVGTEIQVPLKVFTEELSLGYNLDICGLYEVLNNEPLLTKSELKQLKETAWFNLFENVSKRFKQAHQNSIYDGPFCEKIFNWFDRLRAGKASGSRVITSLMYKDNEIETELLYCMSALWSLFFDKDYMFKKLDIKVEWIRLPMFAAFVAKDPHAFDWKKPAGRLLWHALYDIDMHKIKNGEKRSNENLIIPDFMKRRQIYRNFDIMDDDLSSNMHVFDRYFVSRSSPRTLNLREMELHNDWPEYSAMYILENPSVFLFLVDETLHFLDVNGFSIEEIPNNFPALVCTSGQSRNATRFFITECLKVNPNCSVYYSGDLDLSGVQMQLGMERQFLGHLEVWRMDSVTYLKHVDSQNLPIPQHEVKILERMPSDLAKTMSTTRAKVFQEHFSKELKEDWIKILELVMNAVYKFS